MKRKKPQPLNEKTIKFLADDEAPEIKDRRIDSDEHQELPKGWYVIPMVVLDPPEPIRRKKKRS